MSTGGEPTSVTPPEEEPVATAPVEAGPAEVPPAEPAPEAEPPPAVREPAPPEPPGPPPRTDADGPWWRRRRIHEDEPWSHLARAMAYEVGVVIVTAFSVAILAYVGLQGEFQDVYVKLRSHTIASGEVAVLTIGPQAFYTWDPSNPAPDTTPRPMLAQLVRFLDAAGADVIVLDLLLDQPADGDDALAAAAAAHGAVLAAERVQLNDPAGGHRFAAGITPALEGVIHTGAANFQVEQSTLFSDALLVRKLPLVLRTDRAQFVGPWPMNLVGAAQDTDATVPSLSLLAAWLHRARHDPHVSPAQLSARLQRACTTDGPLACDLDTEDLGLPPIPTSLTEPLRINFRGPEHADGIPTVTAARALGVMVEPALLASMLTPGESPGSEPAITVPEDLRRVLEGRVVVVGRVDRLGEPEEDRFVTPYALPLLSQPDMGGPRIHAHVIDTLLSGRHLRTVGGRGAWLLGALLAAVVYTSHRLLRDDVFVAIWLGVAAAIVAIGVQTFTWTDGVALEVGPPVAGILFMLFFRLVRSWAVEESSRT